MAKKKNAARKTGPKKDLLNRLDKSFDKVLAEAKREVEKETSNDAVAAETDALAPLSTPVSAFFASVAIAPCAVLYTAPKFGITLADKGVLLLAVALLSVAVLTKAYEAHVETARKTEKGKSTPTAELQNYAIYFVNLCFVLLFLTIGFLILPVLGSLIPSELNYIVTVLGTSSLVMLWQKGLILKGLA